MGVRAVMAARRRAVFLDRDGVLNQAVVRDGTPYPPANMRELHIVPDAAAALDKLLKAGWLLIGVTNQPDVARGTQRRETVETINAALLAALPLQEVLVCYHDDADGCECRKPQPGLLVQAAARHGVDLRWSFMIGDRWRDIEAGHRAGCRTILIDRGYRGGGPSRRPDYRATSLSEAVGWILGHSTDGGRSGEARRAR